MSWALKFDGSTNYLTLTSVISVGTGDFTEKYTFKYSGDLSQVLTADSSTNNNVLRITTSTTVLVKLDSTSKNLTLSTPLIAGDIYTIYITRASGVVDVKDDSFVSLTTATVVNTAPFTIHGFGSILSSGVQFSGELIEWSHYNDASASTLVHTWSATASDHSNTGVQPVLIDTIGNNDATGVNMPTDGSAWVDLGGGGVTVTGTTPSFNYSSIAASIDLTGSIDITGQTANYTYSPVGGAVDLTGDISITGATASYNYQSINGVVDLTGEITVLGATPNESYSSVSGIIELGAVISVIGITPNYNYQGITGEVSLNGEILVSGETPSYSYSAIKGFVTTGEAQVIGTVTSSFASDVYSSGFKPNTITVNFKS